MKKKLVSYVTPDADRPLPSYVWPERDHQCNDQAQLERWRMAEGVHGWAEDSDGELYNI